MLRHFVGACIYAAAQSFTLDLGDNTTGTITGEFTLNVGGSTISTQIDAEGLGGDVEENIVYDIAYYRWAYPFLFEMHDPGLIPDDEFMFSPITCEHCLEMKLSNLDVLFDWLRLLLEVCYACTEQWELDELYIISGQYFVHLIDGGFREIVEAWNDGIVLDYDQIYLYISADDWDLI